MGDNVMSGMIWFHIQKMKPLHKKHVRTNSSRASLRTWTQETRLWTMDYDHEHVQHFHCTQSPQYNNLNDIPSVMSVSLTIGDGFGLLHWVLLEAYWHMEE